MVTVMRSPRDAGRDSQLDEQDERRGSDDGEPVSRQRHGRAPEKKRPGKRESFRALELLTIDRTFYVFTIRLQTPPPSEARAPRRQQHAQADTATTTGTISQVWQVRQVGQVGWGGEGGQGGEGGGRRGEWGRGGAREGRRSGGWVESVRALEVLAMGRRGGVAAGGRQAGGGGEGGGGRGGRGGGAGRAGGVGWVGQVGRVRQVG